uniref:Uncharacterized protein n=1 Tax=Amphimedon queenslandica TaxID=400682 RepID=A0A1X7UGF6_AMPQE
HIICCTKALCFSFHIFIIC